MNLDSPIVRQFRQRTRKSEQLASRAGGVLPSGVVHDARRMRPYAIYVDRAEGSRKWDVDGNEYVDYVGGHGALLLGHSHPQVTEAARRQLERGTHYGACHELEVQWAEIVQELIPSAELVRFTASGTEATLLAMRLARAASGRDKIVRFARHFHGWQDHAAFGVATHLDGSPATGVLEGISDSVLLCPQGDIQAVEEAIARGDVAAVILEPTGASWGQVPISEGYVRQLRELTEETGVTLIFDEVITGFRCSPGGFQAAHGISPDLTTMAKILAGGFPGGAVAGKTEIMERLDFEASERSGAEKVIHTGTFNANPVCAAAGIACLEIVRDTDACQRASDYAGRLRGGLNRVLRDEGVPWFVYGEYSGFHVFTNPDEVEIDHDSFQITDVSRDRIKGAARPELVTKLRLGMLLHGVDIFNWPGGPTSAVHTEEDLNRTVEAFAAALQMLRDEGELAEKAPSHAVH